MIGTPFASWFVGRIDRWSVAALLGAGVIGGLPPANADIIEVGGAVVLRDPPLSILLHEWESDTEIRGWFENEVVLPSTLTLGHVEPGLVDDQSQLVNGDLAGGTTVHSYMVRLDPVAQGPIELTGFVVFDTPIYGVFIGSHIGDTDDLLGRPGVSYNKNRFRGMELRGSDDEPDAFEISADRMRIDFTMKVGDWTDDIRIVTATTACYADFNGDGAVDTRDVIAFLNAWNQQSTFADCDGNAAIDTRDVICFLNAWTSSC